MKTKQKWYYNEFKHAGADYNNLIEVNYYDEKMQKLRNIKKENNRILSLIKLNNNHKLLEIGCGTGEFSIAASKKCKNVVAIDISKKMLEYAKNKAVKYNINNIKFINSGFLSFDHQNETFDAIVTSLVLHHLPDFWKLIALKRIYNLLKDDSKLYIYDVIFSFELNEYENSLNEWIKSLPNSKIISSVMTHIKNEYSTTSFIMESILKEVGFTIEQKEYNEGIFASYLCKKEKKANNKNLFGYYF